MKPFRQPSNAHLNSGSWWCFMWVRRLLVLEYFFPQIWVIFWSRNFKFTIYYCLLTSQKCSDLSTYPGVCVFNMWTFSSFGVKKRLGHKSHAWSLALLWVRLIWVVSLWRKLNSLPQKHFSISTFISCSVFMWFFKLSWRVNVAGQMEQWICTRNSFATCFPIWVDKLHFRKAPKPHKSQKTKRKFCYSRDLSINIQFFALHLLIL